MPKDNGKIDERDGKKKLVLSEVLRDGMKKVKFHPVPKDKVIFDELTTAVFYAEPVDMGDYIDAPIEIRQVIQTDNHDPFI